MDSILSLVKVSGFFDFQPSNLCCREGNKRDEEISVVFVVEVDGFMLAQEKKRVKIYSIVSPFL